MLIFNVNKTILLEVLFVITAYCNSSEKWLDNTRWPYFLKLLSWLLKTNLSVFRVLAKKSSYTSYNEKMPGVKKLWSWQSVERTQNGLEFMVTSIWQKTVLDYFWVKVWVSVIRLRMYWQNLTLTLLIACRSRGKDEGGMIFWTVNVQKMVKIFSTIDVRKSSFQQKRSKFWVNLIQTSRGFINVYQIIEVWSQDFSLFSDLK